MTHHIMVDIETMGTGPTSAIMSIGAVTFDPYDAYVSPTGFYSNVRLESSMKAGLTVDASTIEWWMKQSDEARAALFADSGVPLDVALAQFSFYVQEVLRKEGSAFRIWAHGTTFDIVVLENAYRAVGWKAPWPYNAMRDDRTLFEVGGVDLREIPRTGTEHNALDDARHQAFGVQLAYRRLDLPSRRACPSCGRPQDSEGIKAGAAVRCPECRKKSVAHISS